VVVIPAHAVVGVRTADDGSARTRGAARFGTSIPHRAASPGQTRRVCRMILRSLTNTRDVPRRGEVGRRILNGGRRRASGRVA
jgi:hypothetical protein